MSGDQPPAVQPPAELTIIITGGATETETAAIVAVLARLLNADERDPHSRAAAGSTGARRSLWNARARAARPRLAPGPGAWRGSALPR